MGGGVSKMAKQELVTTIRDRYQQASKKDKGRILDEFTAITGHHRKHGIRLLSETADNQGKQVVGRRIYDEAVREGVIVVWEASDRICGKRLKAALPNLVNSMERHGHLSLDPLVREHLLSASAATLDRLLKPIRPTAGSRRRRKRRPYMGSQVPVRTYNDWNWPPPGFLEIDLVAHWGGTLSGSFIHSPVSTAWWPPTSARAGRRQFPCWPGSSPWWSRDWRPSPGSCLSRSSESIRTTTASLSTRP